MIKAHPFSAILLALVVSACGATQQAARPARSSRAVVQPLPNVERQERAIALLEKGKAEAARKVLTKLLEKQPRDAVARLLLKQIDTDPVRSLGTESYRYMTKPGDTFQSLAKRVLGDRLRFYELARFNRIAVPAELMPGQLIRLPGDDGRGATAEPRPAKRAELETNETSGAAPPPVARNLAADTPRALLLRKTALVALNSGRVSQAVGLLQQAANLSPRHPLIEKDLQRALRIQKTVSARKP